MSQPSKTVSPERKAFLEGMTEMSKKTGIYIPNDTMLEFSDGVGVDKVQWDFNAEGYVFVQ